MKEKILYNIKKYNIYILIVVSTIICLLVSLFFSKDTIVHAEEIVKETVENDCIVKTMKVDIKGQVKKPGVYEMNENDRIIDLINKSGGLTDLADTTSLNLSKALTDEMIIIIYSKEEQKVIDETNKETQNEENCICSTLISINTSDATTLDSIPGIGLSKANDIINYRNEHGQFKSIEEIKNVSGIGDSLYEKIKSYISI